MSQITMNSDLGESFGLHSFGNDDAIMQQVDLVNVACGAHAGDPEVMRETVTKAVAHGLKVGAHPGLPDLVGFGRREMKLTPAEVESLILFQVGALVAFLKREGAELHHIKPHGSLYGMLARDESLMQGAAKAIKLYDVPMLGMAGTAHESVCAATGIEFIPELYVDLKYNSDGGLIIKRVPESTDPAAAAETVQRALSDGVVLADDGTQLPITFTSICVHSDAPGAGEVAAAVRGALRDGPSSTPDRPADATAKPAAKGPQQKILSPLPGTFYRCPSPGAPQFVADGSDVEAGQTVGLVEIMKQFSEVKTDAAGRNIRFEVEDQGSVNPGDVIAVTEG